MLKLLLAGLLFSSALISGAEAQCQRKYVRKEFRKLTDDERTRFFNAVKKLNEGKKPTTYDKFALAHIANSKFAHGHTGFLVWHRQFLLEFEAELQKVDPEVSIPYWNWPYDSQAPEKSGLFTERYFGGNGNPDNDDCVEDGAFANWQVLYDGSGKEDKHCLKRRFRNDDGSMGVFYAPEAIKAIVDKADKYSDLTRTFEAAPHGGPHVAIGGDMRLHSSPNDPIFWLHHGYVDKVYYDWQVQHPEIQDTYDGFGVNRRPASKSDILQPHKNPVGDVTDINKLCYSYSDDSVQVDPVPSITITSILTSSTDSSTSSQPATTETASGTETTPTPVETGDNSSENQSVPKPTETGSSATEINPSSTSTNVQPLPTQTTVVDLNVTAPEPGKGKGKDDAKIPIDAPDSKDRKDPYKIRLPDPLPEEWCARNKLSMEVVKTCESKLAQVISVFNQIDHISPASLCKRPDLAAKLNATIPVVDKPALPVLPDANPNYTAPTTFDPAPSPTKEAAFSVTVDVDATTKPTLTLCDKGGDNKTPVTTVTSEGDYSGSTQPTETASESQSDYDGRPQPTETPSKSQVDYDYRPQPSSGDGYENKPQPIGEGDYKENPQPSKEGDYGKEPRPSSPYGKNKPQKKRKSKRKKQRRPHKKEEGDYSYYKKPRVGEEKYGEYNPKPSKTTSCTKSSEPTY